MKKLACLIVVLSLVVGMASAQTGRRVALVVGNGAYASNPLKNPVNDAQDVAAALKACGFELTLVLDADLTRFEQAVRDFAARLKGADTGLFYYAGHGVAVDGMNYLLPVSPRIDDAASVRAKAVAVDTIVGLMETSGARTTLVFLDSCRDNPFPGASRSGTRGLAVVPTPRTTNSLVAYATSPGDVAQDGSGRNGIFSGVFIARLAQPGVELGELMRNVKADVAAATGGKQQPRVDDGMKEPFYFMSLDVATARARAERDAAAAALAAIEADLAAREKAIAAATSATEKSALEVEQQRQRALEAAARIEADNKRLAAERIEAEARRQRDETAARQALAAGEDAQAAALRAQVDVRRAEYEKLTRTDDSLDAFIKEIAGIESALADIAARYATAWTGAEADIRKFYAGKEAELAKAQAEPWESDAEFRARVAKAQAELAAQRDAELAARRAAMNAEQARNEKDLRDRLTRSQKELEGKSFTIKGATVQVVYGAFDRDRKLWPVTITSTDPALPYTTTVNHDISGAADMRAAYTAVDTAIKAGAMAAEIDFIVERLAGDQAFVVKVRELRILDLTNGAVVNLSNPSTTMYVLSFGKRLTIAMDCIRVPGGTFTMGSPTSEPGRSDDEKPHQVTVLPFIIGQYEVTFDQYDAFCDTTGRSKPSDEGWGRGNRPVFNVSWFNAIEFCNWLSIQEDRSPAYTISGTTVTWNRKANGYRLPTEAEWEYACRSGTTTAYAFGATITTAQANYGSSGTKPGGSYKPNAWGIYDMHGNVWEWCWDWYGDYGSLAAKDPAGTSSGGYRVCRGGGWFDGGRDLRSAIRYGYNPVLKYIYLGFRVVAP